VLAKLRNRLTFANVVSVLALFVALGGSSYAAIKVTGKNVKDSSLTGKDIKNSSLTTSDVKNRSLLSKDFKTGQLAAGPRGADGTNGFGLLAYPGGPFTVANGEKDGIFVQCRTGTFPTGGDAWAADSISGDDTPAVITAQGIYFDSSGPIGYFVDYDNETGGDVDIELDAACANASTVLPLGKRAHIRSLKRLR
jgi:hypothetical protein